MNTNLLLHFRIPNISPYMVMVDHFNIQISWNLYSYDAWLFHSIIPFNGEKNLYIMHWITLCPFEIHWKMEIMWSAAQKSNTAKVDFFFIFNIQTLPLVSNTHNSIINASSILPQTCPLQLWSMFSFWSYSKCQNNYNQRILL